MGRTYDLQGSKNRDWTEINDLFYQLTAPKQAGEVSLQVRQRGTEFLESQSH